MGISRRLSYFCNMQQNSKVAVKLSLSASKRRVRLDVPLRISQLQQQVRTSFPGINDFSLYYVDDEDDKITVVSDEDLVEAQSVFEQLGRVISFTVDRTNSPKGSVGPRVVAKDSGRPVAPKTKTPACSPDKSANCNMNPFLQMASTLLEHPECFGNAIRTFVGPAMGCNAAMFSGCPGAKSRKPSATAGNVVELHSLSTMGFNGRRGMCGCVDSQTGRHQVSLFATNTAPARTVSVRPCNIRVVSAGFDKSTKEHEQMLPKKTPLGPGSSGPDVVMLQKVLIKLGYMHPSAIRCFQGFYGPRTTASVAKIASAIGCSGGGVFTDRVRAYLLKRLGSVGCESRRAGPVTVPVMVLRKLSTMVPPKKETVSVRKLPKSVPVPTVTEPVSVPTTTNAVAVETNPVTEATTAKPVPVPATTEPVTLPTTESMTTPTKLAAHVTMPEPASISANMNPVAVPTPVEPVSVPETTESVSVAPITEPVTLSPTIEPVSVTLTTEPATVTPITEPATVAPTTEPVTVPATTEPATVAPTTEPVPIPVPIPKTNEKVPTATTESE